MEPTYDMWIKYGELYTAAPGEFLSDLGHIMAADVFSIKRLNCTYKHHSSDLKTVIYYDRIYPTTFDIFWNKMVFGGLPPEGDIRKYKDTMAKWLHKNLITGHMQSVDDITGVQLKCISRKHNFKKLTSAAFGSSVGYRSPASNSIDGCYNILGHTPDKRAAVQIYIEAVDKITVFIYELIGRDLLAITHIFGLKLFDLYQYLSKDYTWDVYEMTDDIGSCGITERMQMQDSIYLTFCDKDGSQIPCLQNKQYF